MVDVLTLEERQFLQNKGTSVNVVPNATHSQAIDARLMELLNLLLTFNNILKSQKQLKLCTLVHLVLASKNIIFVAILKQKVMGTQFRD